jgi:hypothetical protein
MADEGTTGSGWYDYADQTGWLFSGSPLITRDTDPDAVAYHNAFMKLVDRTRAQNKSFRSQAEMIVERNVAHTVGDSTYQTDRVTGEASSTDSTIGISYEMIAPRHPDAHHGMVMILRLYNWTGADITGIHYGAVADFDLDDPVLGGDVHDNQGVGDAYEGWIGGQAGDVVDSVTFTPYPDYMAYFHVPPPGEPCRTYGATGAQVLSNRDYIYPEGQFNVDSLYVLAGEIGSAGTWGTNIRTDADPPPLADDISILLVTGHNASLLANQADTLTYAFGIASSNVSTQDLQETMAALRALTNEVCQEVCPIDVPGDANQSGTITAADIIYLVQHVFKSGPPPEPCAAVGDVNCNGSVSAADIIYLVGHVFKGGPAPCDICNEPDAMECVLNPGRDG